MKAFCVFLTSQTYNFGYEDTDYETKTIGLAVTEEAALRMARTYVIDRQPIIDEDGAMEETEYGWIWMPNEFVQTDIYESAYDQTVIFATSNVVDALEKLVKSGRAAFPHNFVYFAIKEMEVEE